MCYTTVTCVSYEEEDTCLGLDKGNELSDYVLYLIDDFSGYLPCPFVLFVEQIFGISVFGSSLKTGSQFGGSGFRVSCLGV